MLLEGKTEFEELVLIEIYFDALRMVMGEFDDRAADELQKSKFDEWLANDSIAQKMAFSKRVDRWVQEVLGLSIEKPLVMKHALHNVPIEQIRKPALVALLDSIRSQLK